MADVKNNARRNQGPDLAEGAAWAGGGAAGAMVGATMGPLGSVAGAVAGGALADEAVENTQAANQGATATQER